MASITLEDLRREVVREVFREGHFCVDCEWHESQRQGHGETLRRCYLVERAAFDPEDCPGFAEPDDE